MTLARRVHAVIGDILGIVGECCADPERLPHAVAAFAEEMDPSVGSLRTIQQMLERDIMVKLYDGCWGVTRDGVVVGPWLATDSKDIGRVFSLNGKGEPAFQTRNAEGGYFFDKKSPSDITHVFATRAEAEAHVAGPKDGLADAMAVLRAARHDTRVLVQMLGDRYRSRIERDAILAALRNLREADAADAKEDDHISAAMGGSNG